MIGSVKLNEEQKALMNDMNDLYSELTKVIDNLITNSREKSLVITKLEEASMWTNKAIALNNISEIKEGDE